jgi:hypothetical protein
MGLGYALGLSPAPKMCWAAKFPCGDLGGRGISAGELGFVVHLGAGFKLVPPKWGLGCLGVVCIIMLLALAKLMASSG